METINPATGKRLKTFDMWNESQVESALAVAAAANPGWQATPFVERLPYFVTRLRIALIDVPNGFAWLLAAETGLCLAMLLAPTISLGLGFPLVAAVQARQPERLAAQVGTTYAWNTAGWT